MMYLAFLCLLCFSTLLFSQSLCCLELCYCTISPARGMGDLQLEPEAPSPWLAGFLAKVFLAVQSVHVSVHL